MSSMSLFIGHLLTCSDKPGYLSRSVVIRHPLRALSCLPSCLLRPRHGKVSLFIGHLLTCIGKLGYLSLSLVISHPLRALSCLPSCLLHPRHGQVVVTVKKFFVGRSKLSRSVYQGWVGRSKVWVIRWSKVWVNRSVKVWV